MRTAQIPARGIGVLYWRHWCLLMLVSWFFWPTFAFAQYKLQSGDILDVLIVGIPDFRQHVSIGLEGEIGLPLAGQVKVRGLSLADARTRIAGALARKLYRQYAADAREISHLILGGEVVVEVAEYSPIYVSGDISKPGAYAFRPGMTVRQAIALAGGYTPLRLQGGDPFMQAADLQSQYNALTTEYIGQQALDWRLRSELAQEDGRSPEPPPPAAAGIATALLNGEAEQLAARKANRDSSKALLREAMRKATLQLSLLDEKKSQDQAGNQADQTDFNTVRALSQKGLALASRLADVRRAALMSSEQLLQTIAEIASVERQRDEYAKQIEMVDSQTRIDDLQELQKVNLRMAQIRELLKGIRDRLSLVGQLHDQANNHVDLFVHRKGASGPQRIPAGEDLELVPGDVVEAILPRDTSPDLIASSRNDR